MGPLAIPPMALAAEGELKADPFSQFQRRGPLVFGAVTPGNRAPVAVFAALSEGRISAALAHLIETKRDFREKPWPAPYDETRCRSHLGDARKVAWIPDMGVHLDVISSPYFTLKTYARRDGQMAEIGDCEHFLSELDKVWRECHRALVPQGRICCVVGDVSAFRRQQREHVNNV